jgi:hypothetical protein
LRLVRELVQSSGMTKEFSYAYSHTPPKPALHEHAYNEFVISLPAHWQEFPNAEDGTTTFHSDEAGAGITISADFYAIPESKAQEIAEQCISTRLDALDSVTPGQLELVQRSIKPLSTGNALELSFIAEAPGEHVYIYLGYLTSRKILNFTLVCKPGRSVAASLFNEVMESFRPRIP